MSDARYRFESKSAHCRYRPQDKLSNECRELLDSAPPNDKLHVYKTICGKHFKPVFHHFFLETYPTPSEWFEKRVTYTKSAASSSMVGYIVGLGDRHLQNILIDRQSAELIHIDLGIAFEQGKMLKTPEIVPFRLTRGMSSRARQ
jgi:serine-protein kinase ATM